MIFHFLSVIFLQLVYNVSTQSLNCWVQFPQQRLLGQCLYYNQCPFMMDIFDKAGGDKTSEKYQNALNFYRNSICDNSGPVPRICCYPQYAPSDFYNPPDVSNHRNNRLLDENCGPYSGDKIIGGNETGIYEFPWMALLTRKNLNTGDLDFYCGGTIINKRYILTAAHCIKDLPMGYVLEEVRVGEHDTNTLQDCELTYIARTRQFVRDCTEGFQIFGIEKTISHEYYSRQTLKNDLALIRLNNDIIFTPRNVRSICLPVGTATRFQEQKGVVTGWGISSSNTVSSKLLKVEIPIVPRAQCSLHFTTNQIDETQICAGGRDGFDSCSGDSGGPLQNIGNYNNSPRVIQYGIVSFGGRQCGRGNIPAVYTSVAHHMPWILDNLE